MSSTELWQILFDLDERIAGATTTLDREMWKSQRRIVRAVMRLHFPEECPEEWRD